VSTGYVVPWRAALKDTRRNALLLLCFCISIAVTPPLPTIFSIHPVPSSRAWRGAVRRWPCCVGTKRPSCASWPTSWACAAAGPCAAAGRLRSPCESTSPSGLGSPSAPRPPGHPVHLVVLLQCGLRFFAVVFLHISTREVLYGQTGFKREGPPLDHPTNTPQIAHELELELILDRG
jgi:hypothetical protein